MSSVSIDMIVAGFVIINVVLLLAALKLVRSQSTPSLDELMRTVADNANKTSDEQAAARS